MSTLRNTLETLGLTHPEQGFVSVAPAGRWEDSMIVGNGRLGVLVPGETAAETLTVSHERLFMPNHPAIDPLPMAEHLPTIRRLLAEGKWEAATLFQAELGKQVGIDETIWTDPLIPAFQWLIEIPDAGNDGVHARSVDYRTGVACVVWRSGGATYRRETFVSRDHGPAVLRLRRADGQPIRCRMRLRQTPDTTGDTGRIDKFIESATAGVDGENLTYATTFRIRRPGAICGYGGAVRVVAVGGRVRADGDWLVIEGAGEIVALADVEMATDDGVDAVGVCRRRLASVQPEFDELLTRHVEIHAAMFGRTTLRLAEPREPVSSEDLLAGSGVGSLDPRLVARLFDAARYATISSTGEMPPTLQGIWGGTWRPAWSSDLTLDGNVQAAVAGGLVAGYPETVRAFCDTLTGMMPEFRVNARRLFGCEGILVPTRASTTGLHTHFGPRFPGCFWVAGAPWAAAIYYDYWLTTRDEQFLLDQAVPFMDEAARFFEQFCFLDDAGRAVVSPSYSPENTPASVTSGSPACVNATMDIAAIKELLRNLLTLADEGRASFPADRVARWGELLAAMPAYRLDGEGVFKEWLLDELTEQPNHRHASQLYGLYHVPDPDILADPALVAGCRRSIDRRLVYRRNNNGAEMAFGLVQLGLAATSLRAADLAYECIEWMCSEYWTPALVSLHDPGNIFNVDISGGLPGVIAQTLLLSAPGRLELLPSLPAAWPAGAITGLAARGGIGVDLAWCDGRLVCATLTAIEDTTVEVRYAESCKTLCLLAGRPVELRVVNADSATMPRLTTTGDAE